MEEGFISNTSSKNTMQDINIFRNTDVAFDFIYHWKGDIYTLKAEDTERRRQGTSPQFDMAPIIFLVTHFRVDSIFTWQLSWNFVLQ